MAYDLLNHKHMIKVFLSFLIIGIIICTGHQAWAKETTFLVAAWADSPEPLNDFSSKIESFALSGSNLRYIDGRSQWLVLYLVQPGDRILDPDSLIGGSDKEVLQATKIPVDKILVRTFLALTFEAGVTAFNRQPSEFWIGDSAPVALPPLSLQKTDAYDVNTFVPDFGNCKTVTPSCLRSLITRGYLNHPSVIEGQQVDPLAYLENSFHESMGLRQDNNIDVGSFRFKSPITSFKSVISNVTLSHQIWIFLKPSSESIKISTFTDLAGNKIVDYNTPNFPLLKTPLIINSQQIENKIRINPEEMKTLTGSLYDVSSKSQGKNLLKL